MSHSFCEQETKMKILTNEPETDGGANINPPIQPPYYFSVRSYVLNFQPDLRALSDEEFHNQDLQKFFLVPTQFDTPEKNELIAAFINCLLQLLYETDLYNNLHEELRFLLMVLGDATIFLYHDEHGPVQIDLLEEVEAVANLAGSSVYSLLFFTFKDLQFEQHFGVFFERMALLKGNIFKFSNQLPVLNANYSIISNSNKNSSLFIVDSLIIDLENLLQRDDNVLIGDVKDQIKALHQDLMFSWSLFKSISVPPPHDSEIQQHVMIRITEVAFEAEYLIISFLSRDAPLWYFSMRLPHVSHKIKLIATRLQEFKNNYDIGTLKLGNRNFNTSQQLQLQATRNYEVNDNIVVGFEDNIIVILDKLVGGTQDLQKIFIFGMPGIGKTTFAKKLYNDPIVRDGFDKHSWCVVSQMYRRKNLLTDINSSICEIDKYNILDMDEGSLELNIYQSLIGRRYLIVIDDVWDVNALYDLQRCLPDDRNGSRVLITSRNKDVAPPNSFLCALPYLSKEQCWELLKKKVFKDDPCPTQLLGVGKEIASNCHGLPLAVVVIAGILCATDKEASAWEEVGEKVLSYSSCGENDSMMNIMELSYNHLPQHLKPCFLYFGTFVEDEEISAKKLMQFWVAEGFIPKNKESCLAEEYLMQLIGKSLVMVAKQSSVGGVKSCVIHDRLRDLCLKISEEENFLKILEDDKHSIYEKSHRLVQSGRPFVLRSFGLYVRSFHCHDDSDCDDLGDPVYFANMKSLRVLNTFTPWKWGRMIGVEYPVNLRYLVIHENCLSSSIGSLVNLEYLSVITDGRKKIPFLILKMDKLRYLYFFTAIGVRFDRDHYNLSQTNNLQVLSGVWIENLKDEEMLKCSPHLRKLTCDCDPLYVEENGAIKYRYLDLLFFTHLESLTLSPFETFQDQVVEMINFPSNIRKLDLSDLRLPLENMSIIGGLPNLQVLKLMGEVFMGTTWETRDGKFQQLIFLKLENTNFKQWNVDSHEHFPKLHRLVLDYCRNLEEFPCEIGEIPTLQLIELKMCSSALEESVGNMEKEQRDMGNEELCVIISRN